jgi:acetyl esterase/lipase
MLGNTKDIWYRSIYITPEDFSLSEKTLQTPQPRRIGAEWVSVVKPHPKTPVILYCHGGGYSTGSSLYARFITSKLAAATSMDVLSFDYRLAPEHPYPAAIEDAMEMWNYLMLLGYGAKQVFLAGDSAGGNLALSLSLKLKEQGRQLPRAILLFSPWTDLTSSGESMSTMQKWDPVLDPAYIDKMIGAYVGSQDPTNPMISPLFGDYTNFVPLYIQVGQNEVLLDDSTRLYDNLTKAKVEAKLDIFPDMWHVFQMTPFQAAKEAIDKAAEFLFEH